MPDVLTDRQKDVLRFIRQYIEKEGISPTVREIAGHFGFSSPLSVQLHLKALSQKGYITKTPLKTRGIKVIGLKTADGHSIPVLGRIRAGKPIIALEEIDTYITVDKNIYRGKGIFALKVVGDSMIEAGIFENDLVIVKPEKEPLNGNIVVALIDDEVTIKKFHKEKDKVRLVPANSSLKPMVLSTRDVQIIGKVTGVMRRM